MAPATIERCKGSKLFEIKVPKSVTRRDKRLLPDVHKVANLTLYALHQRDAALEVRGIFDSPIMKMID